MPPKLPNLPDFLIPAWLPVRASGCRNAHKRFTHREPPSKSRSSKTESHAEDNESIDQQDGPNTSPAVQEPAQRSSSQWGTFGSSASSAPAVPIRTYLSRKRGHPAIMRTHAKNLYREALNPRIQRFERLPRTTGEVSGRTRDEAQRDFRRDKAQEETWAEENILAEDDILAKEDVLAKEETWAQESKADPTTPGSKDPQAAREWLLADLFPTEPPEDAAPGVERGIDRLPMLDLPSNRFMFDSDEPVSAEPVPTEPVLSKEERYRRYQEDIRARYESRGKETTVLVLRNASKNLDEQDFRALVPRGKHISEWLVQSDIDQIIPHRNPWSLEKTGDYYLVFKDLTSAQKYLSSAQTSSNLSTTHKHTSLLDPIPPAPGLEEDGINIHSAIHSYTLSPEGQKFPLEFATYDLQSSLFKILRHGGYHPIADWSAASSNTTPQNFDSTKVLLLTHGFKMTHYELVRSVGADGRDRGEPWGLIHWERSINSLKSIMERGLQQRLLTSALTPEELEHATENRWILEFKDASSAKSFAQAWHRRPVEGPRVSNYTYPDVLHVEVLW